MARVISRRKKSSFVKKFGARNIILFLSFIGLTLVMATYFANPNVLYDLRSRAQTAVTPCQTGIWPIGTPAGALPGQPAPIWCYPTLNSVISTSVSGANSWLDEFDHGASLGQFNDGDGGYRIFDKVGGISKSKHWRHANHWMVDVAPFNQGQPVESGNTGQAMLRPDRTFTFEDAGDGKGRKMVVEADVATAIDGYKGIWPEIDISTGPGPTSGQVGPRDELYGYGQFKGYWVAGCRLEGNYPICSFLEPTGQPTDTSCSANPGDGRWWEMAATQRCGTTHFGGYRPATNEPGLADYQKAYRRCSGTDPDTNCRDRIRWELWKNGLAIYVNGYKYFEDSGWPASKQLPDAFMNSPVYVYFTDASSRAGSEVFRIHWDRLAINPRDAQGRPLPPSAAPGFTLGGNPPTTTTAPGGSSPTPLPTAIPTATTAPSATPTNTPTPTRTPQATAAPTATPTRTAPTATVTPTPRISGSLTPAPTLGPANVWTGYYYNNKNLSGLPVFSRKDKIIDFNWGWGGPGKGISGNNFSVLWTKTTYFDGGTYLFNVSHDDGMKIFLDDKVIYDSYKDQSASTKKFSAKIPQGIHTLRVQYYENGGWATAKVNYVWQ